MFKKSKKTLIIALCLALVLPLIACGGGNKAPNNSAGNNAAGNNAASGEGGETDFHIGIVTGTASQSEDELRGGEAAVAKYGSSESGGMITHVTYPDNFIQEQETTISKITSLADDPKMKAIIVNQAVPGTVAAFNLIREKNPDILLIANSSQEDTMMIEEAADLVIDVDNVDRGYLIIDAAKKMGATKFVHVSFPRHMSIELLALRRAIMVEAAKDLGIEFFDETAPDPTSDVGIPGAQKFILESMPAWVDKYGKDTAFFATNDAQTEPLLKQIAALGAIFVEQDLPSPIMGYPAAFDVDLKEESGDWPAILKKVEESVLLSGIKEDADKEAAKESGNFDASVTKGRMGTWAYSFGFTGSMGLVEYAKQVVEGTMKIDSMDDLLKAFGEYTEGSNWKGTYYVDRATGEEMKNHILVSQDTYVFGQGYLGMDKVEVPEKYKTLNVDTAE